MTDFRFEQTGEIGVLHFFGELTENFADNLRRGFMVSFESSDYVVVNFSHVTGLDASCFSLFCSAYRIFTKCNKRLLLIGPGPKVSMKWYAAGRKGRSHCVPQCRGGCLWSETVNGRDE